MLNKMFLNKNNLLHNLTLIKNNNPNSKICAMVKANAYGHGLKQIVSLLNGQVDFFGVANVSEAKKVKKYTATDVLIVGPLNYAGEQFCYSCFCLDDIEKLAKLNKPIRIHVKVNSGMNRFGFNSIINFKRGLEVIKNSRLVLQGVFTHFATADGFVKKQYRRFKKFVRVVKRLGFNPLFHADNSAVNLKFNHNLNMVRVGYSLYGAEKPFLPVMSLYACAVQINSIKKGELVGYNKRFVADKPTRVAVLSMGYADGLGLGCLGMEIKIKNQSCRIVNICMDCCMIDIANLELKKGDHVCLIGKVNPICNYAKQLSVSDYQIMCNFGWARADRVVCGRKALNNV